MSTGCVESTCSYQNEQKTWSKVSKGCTLNVSSVCPRLKERCLTDGGKPADCSACTGVECNAKISPEVVWCWNGTVDDDKQAFIQLKCKLLFVALRWGRKFAAVPKQRLSTLSKLWEMKLPFDEFGQTACKALNGTISRKLCDGNWCNAEQGQTEPGHTEPGHTEPTEPGHTEPGHTEPGHTEPTEPGHTESGHTEPGHTEPTEPGHTESGHTEPESGHTEPGQHRVRNGVFVAVPSPTLSTIAHSLFFHSATAALFTVRAFFFRIEHQFSSNFHIFDDGKI
uniref:Uncharacterized protein n=1 Tax=Globodera rostochiensis TaxID=31243 RepID=A0A914GY69_GLORO